MSTLTRRALLAGASTTIAGAALAAPYVKAARPGGAGWLHAEKHPEPLLTVIEAYRAGIADFNLNAPDGNKEFDAYAEKTFRPPFELLCEWTQPAATLAEAVAALQCAYEEERDCGSSDITIPLLAAATAYFESHPVA